MRSLIYRILALVAVVLVALFVTTLLDKSPSTTSQIKSEAEEAVIPVLAQLPSFSLADQDQKPFGSNEMLGRVTIVDFIFTSCPTTCPLLTRQMRDLQRKSDKWRDRVQFVSITVDPKHDSPAVLKEFGTKYEADFSQWHFLSGDFKALELAIVEGYRAAAAKQTAGAGSAAIQMDFSQISHSENFMVVDQKLQIRSYQTLSGEREMQGMLHVISSLL